jgi:NADPH:quinone reductase-like Zn-dependent oxidoreductase
MSLALPSTMRAAQLLAYGAADAISVREVPVPAPGPRDLLVEVYAAAVNPVDCKIRSGTQALLVRRKLPATLGMDLSGVVRAVGTAVTRFSVGDAIFASPDHRRMGACAGFARVREDEAAHKPARLDHVEAASLPLVALTAWDALVRHGRLAPGEKVLIQAGAGGVGSLAIQLAKHLGAEVFATCSTPNVDLVRSLGADHPIDYRKARYEDVARGVDLVVDCLGGRDLDKAADLVRRGGRVVALTTRLPETVARHGPLLGTAVAVLDLGRAILRARIRRNVRLRPMARVPSGENLARIAALVDAGVLRPLVDTVLPLEEIARAHARVEGGRCRGKVVLAVARPDPSSRANRL